MQEIRTILRSWYNENKRDLPWRHTKDAYLIWLSEIILQQTQVKQGLPYYVKFSERFPSVNDLANATEEEVLKLWQGLGYYSRARNLHIAAKLVAAEYGGVFPSRYDDLIKLKGIGDYTASAIASFSSGEEKACIDGNVIRVVSRLFGMDLPYDTAEGKKQIKFFAEEILDICDSAIHNQAIMEFGALQCVPKSCICENCPLSHKCKAFADDKVQSLPFKTKKTKTQDLYLYYYILQCEDRILLQRRLDSGIWKNLYEFPLIERHEPLSEEELISGFENLLQDKKTEVSRISISGIYNHILSHRKIQARFIHLQFGGVLPKIENTLDIQISDFENYPVSRLLERFWSDFNVN